MRQVVTMVIACAALVLVPALSSADERYRGGDGFIRGSHASVFERGHQERNPGKHLGHETARRAHENRKWEKEARHPYKNRYVKRDRHEQCRTWSPGHERHRHLNARPFEKSIVVRERVVFNPIPPVLLPTRLVLHFSF